MVMPARTRGGLRLASSLRSGPPSAVPQAMLRKRVSFATSATTSATSTSAASTSTSSTPGASTRAASTTPAAQALLEESYSLARFLTEPRQPLCTVPNVWIHEEEGEAPHCYWPRGLRGTRLQKAIDDKVRPVRADTKRWKALPIFVKFRNGSQLICEEKLSAYIVDGKASGVDTDAGLEFDSDDDGQDLASMVGARSTIQRPPTFREVLDAMSDVDDDDDADDEEFVSGDGRISPSLSWMSNSSNLVDAIGPLIDNGDASEGNVLTLEVQQDGNASTDSGTTNSAGVTTGNGNGAAVTAGSGSGAGVTAEGAGGSTSNAEPTSINGGASNAGGTAAERDSLRPAGARLIAEIAAPPISQQDRTFQRKVLHKLKIQQTCIESILRSLEVLQGAQKLTNPKTVIQGFSFPLADPDLVLKVERNLASNEANFDALKKYLILKGTAASTDSDASDLILKALMTTQCGFFFNFRGQTCKEGSVFATSQKIGLEKAMPVLKTLLDQVFENLGENEGSSLTANGISGGTVKWFSKRKERLLKKGLEVPVLPWVWKDGQPGVE